MRQRRQQRQPVSVPSGPEKQRRTEREEHADDAMAQFAEREYERLVYCAEGAQ